MEKIITIDGKDFNCRCSAATYIKYRSIFKEDLFTQMQDLAKNIGEDGTIPEGAVAMLLQATYVMALQGDPKMKVSFEEWLDQFSLMGPMNGMQGVYELLLGDQQGIDEAKKKNDQQSAE